MSIAGFSKVMFRFPKAVSRLGIKGGIGYVTKNSIKQVGIVPAIAGIASMPIGAVIAPCPGSAEIAAIGVTSTVYGLMKSPKVIKKALCSNPNLYPKDMSIFTMK